MAEPKADFVDQELADFPLELRAREWVVDVEAMIFNSSGLSV